MAVRWILKGGVEWYIYNIHIYNIYSIYEKKQSKSIFKLHLSHCMYLVACITLIWHNRFQVFMCLCWIHLKKRNYVEPVVSHLSDVSNCKSAIIVIYICRLCIYMYKKYIYIYTYTLATSFAEIVIFERCILWQYKSILTCWTHAAGEMVNECAHMVKLAMGNLANNC